MESASLEVKVIKKADDDDFDTDRSSLAGHHKVVSSGNIGMPWAPIIGVSHRRITNVSVNGNGGEEDKERGLFEYFGWVYHIGTNKIGHEYCHHRFMFIRGKYVEMYKRDPHENPGIVFVAACYLGRKKRERYFFDF
ncbi:hypothetical protein K2173_015663 [Erythroxylum novogranatense]|uniref:Uncharacterized protein n=1 Tax=Erythroxylum novogranatense TaxID=1862640 RepID=A0AAV8SEB6_9ROSI|nr:hypothetical protein K2173_015663 [Erythroxylum novogranatense]